MKNIQNLSDFSSSHPFRVGIYLCGCRIAYEFEYEFIKMVCPTHVMPITNVVYKGLPEGEMYRIEEKDFV